MFKIYKAIFTIKTCIYLLFRIFNKASIYIITMTTTYLAMSLLTPMQLKIFLSYLSNELLLEYLSLDNVYNGNKPISKSGIN